MRQPNTLFYMETYCGGICQCCTRNKILLIGALAILRCTRTHALTHIYIYVYI